MRSTRSSCLSSTFFQARTFATAEAYPSMPSAEVCPCSAGDAWIWPLGPVRGRTCKTLSPVSSASDKGDAGAYSRIHPPQGFFASMLRCAGPSSVPRARPPVVQLLPSSRLLLRRRVQPDVGRDDADDAKHYRRGCCCTRARIAALQHVACEPYARRWPTKARRPLPTARRSPFLLLAAPLVIVRERRPIWSTARSKTPWC